jgi:Transposase DDE domain
MSMAAPKGRKHLSADALFRLVRNGFARILNDRTEATGISLADALMAAFAMFSLKSPSLLTFDKERVEGNLQTIYGIAHAPCDTYMRELLDPVSPESLRPSFQGVFRQLQRGKALEPMMFLQGAYLLALDGTGYFSSKTIHCQSCLHKVHRNGSITYSHQMLGAAIIHPDFREVIPLMPEPIVQQDGMAKNDCERNAAKRFLIKLRQDHPHLNFIVTEDSLSSNAPHIETLHDHGCHYILGVKAGDHAYLFKQVQAAEEAGRMAKYERHDRAAGVVHRFRFVNDVPLNASRSDVRVNFMEYWEIGKDMVQHFSWVTNLRVSKRNVYQLMRGGRARWKIENETFNTLKNQGYNFEHNYGHGEQNLSVVFATIMMLAFLVDQTQQLCCALFRAVWAKLGSKRLLWERLRALFYGYHLESMRELLEALFYGYERHRPLLITDTS